MGAPRVQTDADEGKPLPLVQNGIADKFGHMVSYIVPGLALAYLFVYSCFLSKPPADIEERVK